MTKDTPTIRILIADDHAMFRDGLRRLLEAEPGFSVVGEAADGEQAVKLAQELKPDILLLDLAMRHVPGLEALHELGAASIPVRTILLTAAIEREQIAQALFLGARGVVMKESATELLLRSIRAVMDGHYWVERDCVANLVQILHDMRLETKSEENAYGLTQRELEIVSAIVTGSANKEIAQKCSISEQTVKHHLSHIFQKVGVSNRLELALFAVNHNLMGQ